MRSYKWQINHTNNKYIFCIYPNNSNTQEVGNSIEYDTKKECIDKYLEFKEYVVKKQISNPKSEYLNCPKHNNTYECIKENKVIFKGRNIANINQLYIHLKNNKIYKKDDID